MRLNPPASLAAPYWIAVFSLSLWSACQCRNAAPATVDVAQQRNQDLAALPVAIGGLAEQLAAEEKARKPDADTIRLEAVVERSGVAFGPAQQLLGRPTLAHYCAQARSTSGLAVTVCEYPSVDQARRGLEEAKLVRGKSDGWQGLHRKASVLEVIARSDAPKEHLTAVLQAFDAL